MSDFAHLHLHTQFSFLDGAIKMKDLAPRVADLGMSAVAVTDHGHMFGAVEHYKRAKAVGIKPIMGIEAYTTSAAAGTSASEKKRENFHLVLLAKNNIGYHNLCKLSTQSYRTGSHYYPRMDAQMLYEHREGIVALTACLGGEIGKRAAQDDMDSCREAALTYQSIFGDDFYLEVQPNGIDIQDKVNGHLAQLSADTGIPLVATNDCHYVYQEDHEAQNVLMAIRQQKAWDDPDLHKHETASFYIRSAGEMLDLLKTDYGRAYENACRIAQQCNVDIDLGTTHLPSYPVGAFADEADMLRHMSLEGLAKRFSELPYDCDQEQYKLRLESELATIVQMGFAGYFLIVQDFINWSKQQHIRVGPGRGSGAGSLVAYALRITDVDPIPYNLLFERFLNPERVSMPDFDVDFMQERRGEVIEYVAGRYGRDRVAQIGTCGGLAPKVAIKDVMRTFKMPYSEANALTKMIPQIVEGRTPTFDEAILYSPIIVTKIEQDETFRAQIDIARKLCGLYRQPGTHPGGVVIADDDLTKYSPLLMGKQGEQVTQLNMSQIEDAGLVKFDFLGLKTLDVIQKASDLVRESENDFDIDALMPDDPAVFEVFSKGDTLGVFQAESGGFQEMCRKLKPDCFEDMIAAVALYRPGPMQSGMVDDFIDRKHGRKSVVYPHALLQPILEPTYGTIVYQEQVIQAAQALAGYTLGEADLLRRAMGKKKPEEMAAQKQKFVSGCVGNDIAEGVAEALFEDIEKFAAYGFNKAHSAAYAWLGYQTAYLKRFYRSEFMAALISTEKESDSVIKYIHDARRSGIRLLPPHLNLSREDFTVEGSDVRFGLRGIKGLGPAALGSLMAERKNGPYEGPDDVARRLKGLRFTKTHHKALAMSGAYDFTGLDRIELLRAIHPKKEPPKMEPWRMEKESTGVCFSSHPTEEMGQQREDLRCTEIAGLKSGPVVAVLCLADGVTIKRSKRTGNLWASFTMEDFSGRVDAVGFVEFSEQAKDIDFSVPVTIVGNLKQEDDETPKFFASGVYSVEDAYEIVRGEL